MPDVNYCGHPRDVRIFRGVPNALRKLKAAGFKIVVITNQSGIGRGYFTEEDYRAVEREVERQIGAGVIDATYFCPDMPDSGSTRRKPAPGMVLEAAADHHLDLARSYFIGDKPLDAECGRNAGTRTILLHPNNDAGPPPRSCAEHVARDLVEATELILRDAV